MEPTIVQGIHSALHDGAQRRGDEFEARASASGGVDGAGSKTSEEFPYYPPQPPIIHVSTPQQNEAITELSLLFELLAALEVASLEERRQNSVAMPLKCGNQGRYRPVYASPGCQFFPYFSIFLVTWIHSGVHGELGKHIWW